MAKMQHHLHLLLSWGVRFLFLMILKMLLKLLEIVAKNLVRKFGLA